jgi:hypothetical protein
MLCPQETVQENCLSTTQREYLWLLRAALGSESSPTLGTEASNQSDWHPTHRSRVKCLLEVLLCPPVPSPPFHRHHHVLQGGQAICSRLHTKSFVTSTTQVQDNSPYTLAWMSNAHPIWEVGEKASVLKGERGGPWHSKCDQGNHREPAPQNPDTKCSS